MMLEYALLLAMLLHRSPGMVDFCYREQGLDFVTLVECEGQFNEKALRIEPRGHTSSGPCQLDSEWHDQHRDDLLLHFVEGIRFYRDECQGATLKERVAKYNGGKNPGPESYKWGKFVEKKRDSLALYLWRHLR